MKVRLDCKIVFLNLIEVNQKYFHSDKSFYHSEEVAPEDSGRIDFFFSNMSKIEKYVFNKFDMIGVFEIAETFRQRSTKFH